VVGLIAKTQVLLSFLSKTHPSKLFGNLVGVSAQTSLCLGLLQDSFSLFSYRTFHSVLVRYWSFWILLAKCWYTSFCAWTKIPFSQYFYLSAETSSFSLAQRSPLVRQTLLLSTPNSNIQSDLVSLSFLSSVLSKFPFENWANFLFYWTLNSPWVTVKATPFIYWTITANLLVEILQ